MELLLFFAGWGMDSALAEHLWAHDDKEGFGMDILAFHDYGSLEISPGIREHFESYSKITLIAWSLGVWAAAHAALPRVDRAVALNGTLRPLSERYGISPEVFLPRMPDGVSKTEPAFTGECAEAAKRLITFSPWPLCDLPPTRKRSLVFSERA